MGPVRQVDTVEMEQSMNEKNVMGAVTVIFHAKRRQIHTVVMAQQNLEKNVMMEILPTGMVVAQDVPMNLVHVVMVQ